MAGNPAPDSQSPPSPETLPGKVLRCRGCGNPLTVRGMEKTESIACEACGSILDLTDENLSIISKFESRMKYRPLIPLGSRGKLRGDLFEIIGFLRRAMTVEGVNYEWSEYLLFSPYQGFRWLSEYNGHWNFLKTTTHPPKLSEGRGRPSAKYLDKKFVHFQSYAGRVIFVLGEFYWKVQCGETCDVSDFVCPPLILSREQTKQEVSWTLGEYLEPEAVSRAFQLPSLPPRTGVAPNQPSPYQGKGSAVLKLFGLFCLAALVIHTVLLLAAENRLVFEKQFVYRASDREKAVVTEFFDLPGHTSNVVFRTAADVNNNWLYLHLALINEEGRAFEFGREIGYYHGVEGGERWSEGSASDEAVLPAVPPGRYYLRVEPESNAGGIGYTVQVYRDVPQWSFLLISLAALGVVPAIVKWRSARFEAARWAESDSG